MPQLDNTGSSIEYPIPTTANKAFVSKQMSNSSSVEVLIDTPPLNTTNLENKEPAGNGFDEAEEETIVENVANLSMNEINVEEENPTLNIVKVSGMSAKKEFLKCLLEDDKDNWTPTGGIIRVTCFVFIHLCS